MSIQQIGIKRVRVRASGIHGKQAGEALGRSIAAKLAQTFKSGQATVGAHSTDVRELRVRMSRGKGDAAAIAQSIREAIDKKTAGSGRREC